MMMMMMTAHAARETASVCWFDHSPIAAISIKSWRHGAFLKKNNLL
jgi:hypothetical protein